MKPKIKSRWKRPGYDKTKGEYNGYTVIMITNLSHKSDRHQPQVVYIGDNKKQWSLPLSDWPGKLVPE